MNLTCVICAELFVSSDDVCITSCGHLFHIKCLTEWFKRAKSCPQCRNKCTERNIQKVYFNIANLDTSRLDASSLQQQLEEANLKIQLTETKLKEANEAIETNQKLFKKSIVTVKALEAKVAQQTELIQLHKTRINDLQTRNVEKDELKKENLELKTQIELCESIRTLLAASAADVDKLVKERMDHKTLCTWIVTLKRELKACEGRKEDLRKTLKVSQHAFRKEQEKNKLLEEKIASLESDNYRLFEKVHEAGEQKLKNIPKVLENICGTDITPLPNVDVTASPGILEKVKIIEESNSPYLNIKSSSIGLKPLLQLGDKSKRIKKDNEVRYIRERTSSDLSEKYSIFKKPRLNALPGVVEKNSNMYFNGLGGSERKEESIFPVKRDQILKSTNLNSRIKNGQLKNLPSTSNKHTINKP